MNDRYARGEVVDGSATDNSNPAKGSGGNDVLDLRTLAAQDRDEKRVERMVRLHGRAYKISGGRSVTIHVFTLSPDDATLLENIYGGKAHEHGNGWLWQVANKRIVAQIAAVLAADPPPDYAKRFGALSLVTTSIPLVSTVQRIS